MPFSAWLGPDDRNWLKAGARTALSGPAFYVALSLMSTGALARAADMPPGAAMLATALIWAGPGQVLFFGALAAKAAPAAIALAVSLSSVRLLPMCLSVLPMLRGPRTRRWVLALAAHFIAVTVWTESLRRLPDMKREGRMPFFFGFALTCVALTTLASGLGYWLTAAIPGPLAAGLMTLSPFYFLAATARAARDGADWLAIGAGVVLAPLAEATVGGDFDLPLVALLGGGGAWLVGFYARKAAA
ncbi:Predicted branched-chain amino acid permease (azaleucine resistance) [Rhodoblastus acidophilus]|uniref:Predicted branched-chain amino acid permease (Azaleucine resistance) n=1 Tax=Rhodoblastus acidophilus TaxID=1074 RepID=A0A212QP65_RHOAC|nr:AzlC family ABC transporter permease [Rhodoblastus acidophilus]PPQ38978.1 hypothetical protein CKO16_08605 [Rhodoblastus acidophilus]RAI20086.1 hypothetical protein CH337_10310 [Rhodoblastus acidophilus]SNB61159.1 Predicted branched-chain amino acid permease (azaleucine resistance) [Rhodoblastus acidophilus]